jgi:hypothetical protein
VEFLRTWLGRNYARVKLATPLNPRVVALRQQVRDDRIVLWQLMRKVVSGLGRSAKVVSEK